MTSRGATKELVQADALRFQREFYQVTEGDTETLQTRCIACRKHHLTLYIKYWRAKLDFHTQDVPGL